MRITTSFALLFLVACGGEIAADPDEKRAPTETGPLTIDAVTRDPADAARVPAGFFTLRLHVTNHTAKTAYVYGQAFRETLDDATKVLTLVMHEVIVPLPPHIILLDCHLMSPMNVKLPAFTSADVDVRLPLVQKQIVGTDAGTALLNHPFGTAKDVHVELGWSDVPLQFTWEQGFWMCQQEGNEWLLSRELGVAVGDFSL